MDGTPGHVFLMIGLWSVNVFFNTLISHGPLCCDCQGNFMHKLYNTKDLLVAEAPLAPAAVVSLVTLYSEATSSSALARIYFMHKPCLLYTSPSPRDRG